MIFKELMEVSVAPQKNTESNKGLCSVRGQAHRILGAGGTG